MPKLPDNLQPVDGSPNPQLFSSTLRARAEEALAASVHHASLSQQYLTLAQKFSALAEQSAAGHVSQVQNSFRELQREVATGSPAAPIGAIQSPVISAQQGSAVPGPAPVSAAAPQEFTADPAARLSPFPADSATTPMDPPGVPFAGAPAQNQYADSGEKNDSRMNGILKAAMESSADSPAPETAVDSSKNTLQPKPKPHRRTRKRLSVRSLLDRARLAALEQAQRVRLKVRKSDLKPQLRKTSDEIREELKRGSKPSLVSVCLTIIGLLIMMLLKMQITETEPLPPLMAGFSDPSPEMPEPLPLEPPMEESGEQQEQPAEEPPEEMVEEPEPEEEPMEEPPPEPPEPMPEPPPEVQTADASLPETPNGTLPSSPDAEAGPVGKIDNRSDAGRKLLLEKFGGNAASESAVGFALEWLAARQRPDGSWDFSDVGPCSNPGTMINPIGGTGYALLPFLAAGQTHRDGAYRKTVQRGLEYLTSIGVAAPAGYDLRGVVNRQDDDEEPNYAYYVHGAATLALCEAYGMTKDRALKAPAEGAVAFLVNSQDPQGGGWRYVPRQPGSTSCTAIQVMALKAAEKAGMRIPDGTWQGVTHYLDSVAVDREGRYGYEVQKKTYAISVTSMALLCRMYLGWNRQDGDLRPGVALLDKRGPYDNLYYNYFATQVMRNWGGREWERWNGRLRDDLIAWQEKDGDARGSWAPRDRDDYSKSGGRLLTTCLATLTLEVYYRYQPLLPEMPADSEPGSTVTTTGGAAAP